MFEDLLEKSVRYDDNLLQAACIVQAEFDLESVRDLAIIKATQEFRQVLREVSEEYRVNRKQLFSRLKEILTDDSNA